MAKGRNNDSADGCATVVGGAIFGVVVLVAMIPKEIWIVLGIVAVGALLLWGTVSAVSAYEKHHAAAVAQERAEQAAKAAEAKREQEEHARWEKRRRIDMLGVKNAALVESARAAVTKVVASEAARAGWLGDVDFTPDLQGVTELFRKSHDLRRVAGELSALNKPSADDRRILAEAKTTAANLERAGVERVELIERCATEARLIDESLRHEREDARTAEQRAELHAKLSAMLYGIEATPDATPSDSAADAVIARVQAYREIKNQIQQSRDSGFE